MNRQTAQDYIRQMLGDLMMQIAVLRAENDQLRGELAEARPDAAGADRRAA